MDDREALHCLQRGEIRGLESLVSRYQERALKVAYLVVGERTLAEDVVQDAFLRVYERARQFDLDRPFQPWFTRIVVNRALKVASRQSRSASLDQTRNGVSFLSDLVLDPTPSPQQMVELAELREMVWAAVQQLSPAQRAVVVQRYYLGLSDGEIAMSGGKALGTVKSLLHRARERLRGHLGGLNVPGERKGNKEVSDEQQ